MRKIIVLISLMLVLSPMILAESIDLTGLNPEKPAWDNMTCEEKLNKTVNMYNNCSKDFHQGKHCGMVFGMQNSQIKNLTDRLEEKSIKEAQYKTYKYGFWIAFGVLVLLLLIKTIKSNK